MNWLAHVLLSESEVDFRLGNLLADLVRGEERSLMSPGFLRGAQCHKLIDAYTDSHPVVRRSRARLGEEYRRFSGVLVDIFYDYLLAEAWSDYVRISLERYTADFYTAARGRAMALPARAQITLDRILEHDLLGSYRHIEGLERSLRRLSAYLSSRWRREFALERSVAVLLADEEMFAADFAEFFPALALHVDRNRYRISDHVRVATPT